MGRCQHFKMNSKLFDFWSPSYLYSNWEPFSIFLLHNQFNFNTGWSRLIFHILSFSCKTIKTGLIIDWVWEGSLIDYDCWLRLELFETCIWAQPDWGKKAVWFCVLDHSGLKSWCDLNCFWEVKNVQVIWK